MLNCSFISALLLAQALCAQTAPPQTRTVTGGMGFPGTFYQGPAVKGKPYSAQQVDWSNRFA